MAYSIRNYERLGKAYSQLWILTLADGRSTRIGDANGSSSEPEWSPDGRRLAFVGNCTSSSSTSRRFTAAGHLRRALRALD
ncbi:MAG TPA: hypothetical protein VFL57_09320 [Bryobacteraceae bacterium]|nr:hypothetical protein [Bryobacteraceae bacterium]